MKKVIHVEEPKIKRSIREAIDLPKNVIEEAEAKISLDSRGQFFVRFPSVISEVAKITKKDKIRFKVVSPLDAKSVNEIILEMKLAR